MKLYEFTTWKPIILGYYTTQINSSAFSNKADLLSSMNTFISDLETAFNSYKTSTALLKNTKKALISAYTYVTNNYISVIVDPEYPASEIVFDEALGFRSMFGMFLLDFPNHETSAYFTITGSGIGVLTATTTYTNLKSSIQNMVSSDGDRLTDLYEKTIPTTDQILYRMYANQYPEMVINNNIKVKPFLLDDLGFQDCIDKFNWDIIGFN